MLDATFTSVGEAILTLHGIAHYTPMLTRPTRVFLCVKLRLVGVALAGRQCGMAAALTTSWRDYGYVALQRLAGHLCEGL
jgi:hypothetical protein